MTFSGFSVSDQDEAKKFYSETLGLTVKAAEMGLSLKLKGGEVFLYQKDNHQPATFTVLNFIVADINATVDNLVQKGVTFERYDNLPAGQDDRGILRGLAANMGPDIAWFKDPSGNVLAIIQDK
jgi:predicted enzyme related to lactoylglutathione lyase